jgi:hypothetical protein
MPDVDDLTRLLLHPNESLSVEYKSWLDLQENADRARLSKAVIALANYGGGIVVLGMRQDNADGRALVSLLHPQEMRRYSQDDINAAIRRFAEPAFHCELLFALHPITRVEHAFVVVPADVSVPVMSSRDCNGVIKKWCCYTRKPGPRSEEPQTGEEWRLLLDKCVRARREEMLDAIRTIVQGKTGGEPTPEAADALLDFATTARSRWETLIQPLAVNDVARLQHGRYELSFEIIGIPPIQSLDALRIAMEQAGRIRHTGWGPFVSLGRPPYEVRPVNGAIEAWLGAPDPDNRRRRTAGDCDFWMANSTGKFFLMRGYEEDEIPDVRPGTALDLTLPIWQVGETLLYIARLASNYDENPSIAIRCHYFGLQGRELAVVARPRNRLLRARRTCHDPEAILEMQVTARQIIDTLAEIVHPLLVPLYERFGFFELPMRLVSEELTRLRGGRF